MIKQLIVIEILFLLSLNGFTQNVGIGTNTPQSTLDVNGNVRFGGAQRHLIFDSITGRLEWRNSTLYVPVTQALIKHSNAGDGLFYNNTSPVSGQLEYRDILGIPVFYTNFINGQGYFKGFLGVGTTNPLALLHVKSVSNNPVILEGGSSMWVTLAENGIHRGYIGSFAGNPEDVDFGSYSGTTGSVHLTTNNIPRLTVINNGNVGIGKTVPSEKMDISGNVKANNYLYNSPKTFYHSIHPSAFKPYTQTDEVISEIEGTYYITSSTWGLLMAPLYLPHGATITSVTVHFYDNSSLADLVVNFMYKPVGSGAYDVFTSVSNTGTPGNSSMTTNSIFAPQVNNLLNSYFIFAASIISPATVNWPGNNLKIKDIVISYTLNEAQ